MAQTIIGTVSSIKMNKTIVVTSVSRLRHPMYKKVVTKHRSYKAHSDLEGLQIGDMVEIKEVRPISKTVHFTVSKKI